MPGTLPIAAAAALLGLLAGVPAIALWALIRRDLPKPRGPHPVASYLVHGAKGKGKGGSGSADGGSDDLSTWTPNIGHRVQVFDPKGKRVDVFGGERPGMRRPSSAFHASQFAPPARAGETSSNPHLGGGDIALCPRDAS